MTAGSNEHINPQFDVSVIIVNHNTKRLLHDCLRSLAAEAGYISIQTIVVDNGSADGSPEMVKAEFPETVLIRNSGNEGFAKPNNQGLHVATGRYCLLLNSDTVVKTKGIAGMVRFMDSHDDVGACGPRLVNPDGSLQRSVRSFPSLWRHFCDMSGLENLFPRSPVFGNFETRFSYDRTVEVDQPMGAALMVRSEILDSVGYLDEQFVIYYNEVDWCSRIRSAGWKIYFVHTAEIIHYGGKTTEMTNQEFRQFDEMNRNCLSYYEKHFGLFGLLCYRFLLIVGFTARVLLWQIMALIQDSPKVRSRLYFAKRFLVLGVRLWERPAKSA